MNIKPRAEGSKSPVRKVLIVCEGAQTEPNYFRAFRVASRVCDVRGTGYNTVSLVREAKRLSKLDLYREVWCVFDNDSFTEASVKSAHQLASREGFKVAFSNECFELWYLLHYKFLDTGVNRSEYSKQLNKLLGSYQKNATDMYERLRDRQSDAIKHAKKLSAGYGHAPNVCQCKPYTTVHELVERLNHLARKAI